MRLNNVRWGRKDVGRNGTVPWHNAGKQTGTIGSKAKVNELQPQPGIAAELAHGASEQHNDAMHNGIITGF